MAGSSSATSVTRVTGIFFLFNWPLDLLDGTEPHMDPEVVKVNFRLGAVIEVPPQDSAKLFLLCSA